MLKVKQVPMTHGMEIEQFHQDVPMDILEDRNNDYFGTWGQDYGDVYEVQIGPSKRTSELIRDFLTSARQQGSHPWQWRTGRNGYTAGSHIHLNLDQLDTYDDTIKAWTISHNTIVDLVMLLSPFFCHNWREGYREGEYYNGNVGVQYYASPVTERRSQSSVSQMFTSGHGNDGFNSVTFKSETERKPLTIELRMVDSHPTFALTGVYLLRRMVKRCLERDLSIKIENRGNLMMIYRDLYNLPENENILSQMNSLPITFERGIPGIEQLEFDSMWECLDEILKEYLPQPDTLHRRVVDLVRASGKLAEMRDLDPYAESKKQIPDPSSAGSKLWNLDNPEFEWSLNNDFGRGNRLFESS